MAGHRRKITALFAAAALLLGACSGRTAEDVPEEQPEEVTAVGREIEERRAADGVFSVNYDPEKSLNPIKADSSTNMLFWSLMYDSVFVVDNDYSFSSELVTDYTTSDNTWWVFNIDTSIRFTDGTTLTAYDIVYSIRQAQLSSYYSQRLSVIYGVSAMGEDCFAITTKYADSLLPALLNIPVIKDGSMSAAVPPGSGPYRLAEEGDRLELFEGSRHADEMPVDTIYLKSYMDTAEKISAFEDSRIDIVTNDPTGMYNLGYGSSNEIRYYDTTNMHFIGFNMQGMYFQNAGARYAVAYAIDRETIVSSYMSGSGVAAALPVLPSSSLYDADYAAKFSYDPEKCLSLFAAADVKDHDSDGAIEFKVTGIVVETDIDFIVNNNSTVKLMAARKLAEDLNAIGITTTLRELSWDDYIEALEAGDYDMYYGEIRLSADWNLANLFEAESGMNYAQCTDPNFSQLYYDYLAADDAARTAAFRDAARYLVENGGLLPICFERRQALTHRSVVSGLRPTEYDLFHGIKDWTITLK